MNVSFLDLYGYIDSSVNMTEVTANIIYTGLLVIVGLFGNAYCVIQLRSTNLRRFALSSYLFALAVSDSCFLLSLTMLFFYNLGYAILSYPTLCQFTYYISYLSCFLSGWYIVALSIERCIAVYRPIRSYVSNIYSRSIVVICWITVLGMVLNSWPLFVFERRITEVVVHNTTYLIHICDISDSSHEYYKMLSYFDAAISCFIPITLIILLNLLIIRRIFKAQSIRNVLINERNSTGISPKTALMTNVRKVKKRNSNSTSFVKMRNRERKVAMLLLAIPVAHIILNAPNYLYGLIFTFIHEEAERDPYSSNSPTEIVFQFIFYSQYSINFILYTFRNRMISCRRKKKQSFIFQQRMYSTFVKQS